MLGCLFEIFLVFWGRPVWPMLFLFWSVLLNPIDIILCFHCHLPQGIFPFFFFWPHSQHMEVYVPGIKSELQLRPMPQLWKCWIVNPQCHAGNWNYATSETCWNLNLPWHGSNSSRHLKISSLISLLSHWIFSSILFSLNVILFFFMWLMSNFMLLCWKKMLELISTILSMLRLRFVLCPKLWSIQEDVLCALEKHVCSVVLGM